MCKRQIPQQKIWNVTLFFTVNDVVSKRKSRLNSRNKYLFFSLPPFHRSLSLPPFIFVSSSSSVFLSLVFLLCAFLLYLFVFSFSSFSTIFFLSACFFLYSALSSKHFLFSLFLRLLFFPFVFLAFPLSSSPFLFFPYSSPFSPLNTFFTTLEVSSLIRKRKDVCNNVVLTLVGCVSLLFERR